MSTQLEPALSTKLMLLTKQLYAIPSGGRELLCKLNHEALKEIYGERLVVFELPRRRLQGVKDIINAFRGHIDGLDAAVIAKALQTIRDENVSKVFVDGSNLGGFVKIVKQQMPQVEVCTFFHNVEARFFLGSMRQTKTFHALAVMIANYLAEKKSVRHSDKIICLSERDSRLLYKIYGRSATHVSAMAVPDKLVMDDNLNINTSSKNYGLFVGGVFYANRAGIAWFVENVVPRINVKICIVGRGFEALKQELEREGKVEVIGAVDDLAQWYGNAQFVIAPIFDGSGMKVKVAEALMFGKKIIGTPEAFSGYEDVVDKAGWMCKTVDDFVTAIALAQGQIDQPFYSQLRVLYEDKYSFDAAKTRLAGILG